MSMSRPPASPSRTPESRLWVLPIAAGAVSIVVGLIAIVFPTKTLNAVAVLVGIGVLIVGLLQLTAAFGAHRETGRWPAGRVAMGGLAVVAGIVLIARPGHSLRAIAVVLGLYLVAAGIVLLGSMVGRPAERRALLVAAAVDIVIGIVLVAWPGIGVGTVGVIVGVALVVQGAVSGGVGLTLRRLAGAA
jgi:uncharacterized membrane protein HdeD (DUF308 family)